MQKTPFNPVLSSNLDIPANESQTDTMKTKPAPRKTAKRRTPTRRGIDPKASAFQFARKVGNKAKTSWTRIKRDMQSRLSRLDSEQLKRILVACGIAATAALIIIALAQHTPLMVVLLAGLGAMVILKIWNRLLGLGF